jgi:hypothetical protein
VLFDTQAIDRIGECHSSRAHHFSCFFEPLAQQCSRLIHRYHWSIVGWTGGDPKLGEGRRLPHGTHHLFLNELCAQRWFASLERDAQAR